MIPVLTAFHKTVKISRQDQSLGRIVTQYHNLTIQNFLHCPVRPLRCLILRKRRIPDIFCQLFQHPAVQYPVNPESPQTFFYLFKKFFMYQILHIQYLRQRMRTHPCVIFLDLQPGIPKSFPHQCTVTLHTVRKSFPGTAEHLFRFCLHHPHGRITFTGDFHRPVIAIYKKNCIPCQHGSQRFIHICQFLYICNPQTVILNKFLDLLRGNLPEMIDHLSNGRIIQHHIGNCNFYIDHQAVHLLFLPQPHGTDKNITAFLQPASQIFFIFPQICRNLSLIFCFFHSFHPISQINPIINFSTKKRGFSPLLEFPYIHRLYTDHLRPLVFSLPARSCSAFSASIERMIAIL